MRLLAIMLYVHFSDEDQSYNNDFDEQKKLNHGKCISRISLKRYKYSSFTYLYLSGDDQALVNSTGRNQSSFNKLLHKFKPIYDIYV